MSDTRKVAKHFAECIEGMEFVKAFGMLALNGKYIVIGSTKASRTYDGRQDVFENLIPVLSNFPDPPRLKFQEPIIEGERAVLLASGKGEGPTGCYDQPYYAFVTRVHGNEFSEIIEFMDTTMLETAIFGRKLVESTAQIIQVDEQIAGGQSDA